MKSLDDIKSNAPDESIIFCPLIDQNIEGEECFDVCMTLHGVPKRTARPDICGIFGYQAHCRYCENDKEHEYLEVKLVNENAITERIDLTLGKIYKATYGKNNELCVIDNEWGNDDKEYPDYLVEDFDKSNTTYGYLYPRAWFEILTKI